MTLMRPVDALAEVPQLDGAAERLTLLAHDLPQAVRNLLHGTWLGHPLHPVLAMLPVGAWTSAAILDALTHGMPPGERRAGVEESAQTLVGIGLAAAPAAALAGVTDLAELHTGQQRIGVAHAAANTAAVALLGGSYLLRRRGHHAWGRALGLLGTGIAGAGAAIGGHLSYAWAAGADHAEEVPHVTPPGWHYIARLEELPDGGLWRRTIGETPVVVLRRGPSVRILADRCSHLAGPLSDGDLVLRGGADCVVCPWHGSTFRFADGSVVDGPATTGQPVLEVRIEGGAVSARVAESAVAPT